MEFSQKFYTSWGGNRQSAIGVTVMVYNINPPGLMASEYENKTIYFKEHIYNSENERILAELTNYTINFYSGKGEM